MDEVIADFEHDWTEMLRVALRRDGYFVDTDATPDRVGVMFFNVQLRRVPEAPRVVREADSFTCPTEALDGWAFLRGKVERGEDLTPHLSRNLRKDYADPLLNDWGIHHFHLGTTLERNGLISRSGPIVFAFVTSNEFLAINVRQHGKRADPTLWSDRRLVETVHRNWPQSIRQYRLGFVSIEADLSSEEIRELRADHGWASLRMPDGTIYFPAGGGYGTDGTSLRAVADSDHWLHHVEALERHVRRNVELIVERFRVAGHVVTPPYEFRLDMKGDRFRAVEMRSRCAVTFRSPGESRRSAQETGGTDGV